MTARATARQRRRRGVCGQLAFGGALLALAAAASGQDSPAPAGDLRVRVEPETITAGDRAQVTVELVWPAGSPDIEPRFPAWQDTWGQAEVLAVGPVERTRAAGGDTVFRQVVTITAFEVGDTRLPPITVALPIGDETREVETPRDLALVVASVLPEGEEEPAVLPAAAPEALPVGQRFVWTAGLLTLLCALAAWRALSRQPTATAAGGRPRPSLPPLEELHQRLRGIDAEHAEAAHTTISFALRSFLGRSTGVPAIERTTTEIRRSLQGSAIEPDLGRRLITLLARCDEVKFIAGASAEPATTAERVRAAGALADDIDRSLRDDQADAAQRAETRAAA